MSPEQEEELLEKECCKYQLMPFLRDAARLLPIPYEVDSTEYGISVDVLAKMFFYKRTQIEVLVGLTYPRFKMTQTILDVIQNLINKGLLDYDLDKDQIVTHYSLNEETNNKLTKMMYPLPMLIKPEKVLRNCDTGYKYLPKASIILRNNYTKDDVNLDHINRVNSIKFQINEDVLQTCSNKNKSTSLSYQERKNWNIFTTSQQSIANAYKGKVFYLTHKYDKRGRVYCVGYWLSYQSNDYGKALIQFSAGEKVK